MARAPAQILPAGQLTARPRRGQVQGRSQRPHRAVPLPRLPHPDPVDPIDRRKLTNPLTWRARCGESRTPGSAGGLWKPTTGNRGRAPQPDPTGATPDGATNTSPSSSTSPPSAPARHGRWRWSKAAPNRHSRPGCPSNPRPGARASKSWAIDRFTGFKTATIEEIPTAVTVRDPSHVIRLAGDALDVCRRRVQGDIHGPRGRENHLLY